MSAQFDPTPRPALRKAADADIHPTTHTAAKQPPSTADSVLEGKRVPLVTRVPKKLRKKAREQAKAAGISIDDFVAAAIAAEVARRSH